MTTTYKVIGNIGKTSGYLYHYFPVGSHVIRIDEDSDYGSMGKFTNGNRSQFLYWDDVVLMSGTDFLPAQKATVPTYEEKWPFPVTGQQQEEQEEQKEKKESIDWDKHKRFMRNL